MKGALLSVLGLTLLPATSSADTRFALVVGHNVGTIDETPLRWAESDATRVREVLTTIGDVRSDRAMLLLGPTREEFERARLTMEGRLQEAKARGERTIFLVYFSGHADQKALHLASETVDLARLEKDLKEGAASTVIQVVDACRNDRNPRVKTKGATRAPAFSWPSEGEGAPRGYVRLSSASEGEVAQESDDLQGSLFTHHLLSGMRGSADLDTDGTVTLDELYRYGYARTLEDTHRQTSAVQHSELDVKLSGRGALIVTYPRRAVSLLEFGDDVVGHLLLIDDASGRIVAELRREGGPSTRLAVAPGRYRVQLRETEQFRSGLVALGSGRRQVRAEELEVQNMLAVLMKGPAYDPHPYLLSVGAGAGRSAVEGFGVAPSINLGFDYRLSSAFRIGARLNVGAAIGNTELWERRQIELVGAVSFDWSAFFSEQAALILGLRGGIVTVFQEGQRADESRLGAGGIRTTEESNRAVGPRIAAVAGVEYHPFTQVGLRFELEPFVSWLRQDGAMRSHLGLTGNLALVVRL